MQNEMDTEVEQEQDALIALVKEDHSLINSNNVPVWTAGGWEMRIRLNLQRIRITTLPNLFWETSAINSTFNSCRQKLRWRSIFYQMRSYLVGCWYFDQGVHLIQPTAVFLLGHMAQAESVCILVSQKFNVAPHRHFKVVLLQRDKYKRGFLQCLKERVLGQANLVLATLTRSCRPTLLTWSMTVGKFSRAVKMTKIYGQIGYRFFGNVKLYLFSTVTLH